MINNYNIDVCKISSSNNGVNKNKLKKMLVPEKPARNQVQSIVIPTKSSLSKLRKPSVMRPTAS